MRAIASHFHFRAIRAGTVVLAVLATSNACAAQIFVAGSDPLASDENPGTEAKPLKTIQKAASIAAAGDTILIRAGTYRETVTPAHSGTSGAPITYLPYNNELVVIDGADTITNWTKTSGSIYQAPINWSVNHGDGDQVFVDGQMMNYARYPNSSLDVSNPTRIIADTGTHVPASPAFLQACSGTYTSPALKGFLDSKQDSTWVGATIHFEVMGQGYLETGTVTSTSPGSVTFNYVSQVGGPGDPAAGDPFYLTGKLAALDTAGEWFRDATSNTLYLWTPTGDRPANHVVEAKARTYGFDLSGLSYITLQGIRFFSCSINTSSTSTHVTIDGIQALYVSHFEQASGVQTLWTPHMEDTGLIIRGSSNVLKNSEIGFSAGNGVLLQGNNTSLSTGNVVTNNVIHDVDYMCLDEAGINTGNPLYPPGNGKGPSLYDAMSTYNTISYNTIYNSGRSLILIRNFGSGLIVHNDLYNGMLQSLDGGAIYTYNQNGKAFNSSHPVTRIAYNRIHNTHGSYDKLDVGIYIDNNSPNYVLDHNLIYDVWLPVYLNADSHDNIVCNNTLYATVFGTACLQACGDGTGTVLANNIYGNRTYIPGTKYASSHNLDAKDDPLFVDPAALNFELQSGSRAKDAGRMIPPYTDGYVGSAPDIGAFEYGATPWTAGASAATNPFVRAVPATPTHLTATAAGPAVTLAWRGNATSPASYLIEGSADDLGFTPIVSLSAGTTSYTDSATIYRYCRICAVNGPYRSGYSNFARSNESSAATAIAAWTHSAASNPAGANWWDFWLDSHNWVKYSDVYFDSSLDKVHVTYATDAGSKYAGNRIEFRLDQPTGPIIGDVVTQSTGGWNKFVTASGTVRGVASGVHDLYVTCSPVNAPWPAVAIHSFAFSDTAGLAAPTELVATRVSNSAVNLSWAAHSNKQAGFKMERSTDAQTFMEIGTVGANGRIYQDTTGSPNTSYYYRVRAYNQSSGNSAYSHVAASQLQD
ncbi:MAG: carbohydrate-binding protein [Planctomycetota bacterium]|nr:carbohydrate-binding protein [Planctomycetota bacterium]